MPLEGITMERTIRIFFHADRRLTLQFKAQKAQGLVAQIFQIIRKAYLLYIAAVNTILHIAFCAYCTLSIHFKCFSFYFCLKGQLGHLIT